MIGGRRRGDSRFPRVAGLAGATGAVALLALTASSCSSPGAASSPDTQPPIPLASSSVAPGSDSSAGWATLAMGHLDDPVNTFWQLFSLADGSDRWTLVTPPGVASNGGLAASVTGHSVLAGFGPSQDLHFSPLAASTDGGERWTAGLILGHLAPVPDSLSTSTTGHPFALLQSGGGTVVTSTGDLSTWTPVVSRRTLAAGPSTSSCGVERLSAVASAAAGAGSTADTLVGAACTGGDHPGIFESAGHGWEPVGPRLPGAKSGPSEVIRLEAIPGGAAALVSAGRGGGAELYALSSTDGLRTWTVSPGFPLGRMAMTSTGLTPDGGFVVTTSDGDGRTRVAVVDRPASGWHDLAPPPSGTSAVVAVPGGAFDALVPRQSVLDVYTLRAGGWDRTQALDVPIQYGSSG